MADEMGVPDGDIDPGVTKGLVSENQMKKTYF